MLSYCLKCKKNTMNINPKVLETNNDETMLLSKCVMCSSKKLRFIKKQEASRILLSRLGVKTPLNNISLLGDILLGERNDIVNKLLSAGNKFMPKMHLKQPAAFGKPGFTYSACGPFTNNKGGIQKFKGIGDTKYIYKNELDKLAFNIIWFMEILKI